MKNLTKQERIRRGQYFVSYFMTSGTAKLQIKIGDGPLQDLTGSLKSEAGNFDIWMPNCEVLFVGTGGATCCISQLSG